VKSTPAPSPPSALPIADAGFPAANAAPVFNWTSIASIFDTSIRSPLFISEYAHDSIPALNPCPEMAVKLASVLRFKFGRDIDNAVIRLKQALHPMIRRELRSMIASRKTLLIDIESPGRA
jgi:hypothetical protein